MPPTLSIVIVAYRIERELPRTLQSFSVEYQEGVQAEEYEVVVVDNGSPAPIDPRMVRRFGPNFKCCRIDEAPPSPARAANLGVRESQGEVVGVLVDGARIVTPGVLKYALAAFSMYPDPTVATLAWHLGPGPQQESMQAGYDQEEEDRLLASVGWPRDGYRLFEISALAPSSSGGYSQPLAESNAIFLRRSAFEELGGFEEAFDQPGGGFVNLDFYRRACERPGAPLVILLGEGSFHQIHGGVSTNASWQENARLGAEWVAQYERIREQPWRSPDKTAELVGRARPGDLATIDPLSRT